MLVPTKEFIRIHKTVHNPRRWSLGMRRHGGGCGRPSFFFAWVLLSDLAGSEVVSRVLVSGPTSPNEVLLDVLFEISIFSSIWP